MRTVPELKTNKGATTEGQNIASSYQCSLQISVLDPGFFTIPAQNFFSDSGSRSGLAKNLDPIWKNPDWDP